MIWGVPDSTLVTHPLLDAAERACCARLSHEADRARHATGRVLAKIEGARQLAVDPRRVSVVPDVGHTAGRPRLLLDGRPCGVHVSLAHAGDVVVVALGRVACGVDVEEVAALEDVLDVETVFSRSERNRLAAASPEDRLPLAARWWTAKEAALKAVGVGLAMEAADIDADASTIRVRALGTVTRLRLMSLEAPDGYSASLAFVRRRGRPLVLPRRRGPALQQGPRVGEA